MLSIAGRVATLPARLINSVQAGGAFYIIPVNIERFKSALAGLFYPGAMPSFTCMCVGFWLLVSSMRLALTGQRYGCSKRAAF
jgi:hypothetical protein